MNFNDWVYSAIQSPPHPKTYSDLMDAVGFSKQAIVNAVRDLSVAGKVRISKGNGEKKRTVFIFPSF